GAAAATAGAGQGTAGNAPTTTRRRTGPLTGARRRDERASHQRAGVRPRSCFPCTAGEEPALNLIISCMGAEEPAGSARRLLLVPSMAPALRAAQRGRQEHFAEALRTAARARRQP